MAKKTENKPTTNLAPRQQQIPIKNKSSEELALLLGEQYKMLMQCQNNLMQCQNNIAAINNIVQQRRQQALQSEKDKTNGNAGN